MLHNFMALVPAALGARSGSRFRRGGEPRGERPTQEDLGKWIWIGSPEPVPNSYIQARRTFSLRSAPTSALVKTCADDRYKLFVNGQYVGKGPVRSPEGYCYFDTHDITELLKKGDNVIAFLVHHIGENTYSSAPGKPGLVCKAEIEAEGETEVWGTDETWKVRRATEWLEGGARMSHRLGFQEVYDMANAPENWTEVKFNEKGWEAATVVASVPALPWGELRARQIPQLREETILPKAIISQSNAVEIGRETPPAMMPDMMAKSELTVLKAGDVKDPDHLLTDDGATQIRTPRGDRGVALVLDFGREVFGNVEVGIAGSGGGCIDIGYSEALLDGRVKPNLGDTRYSDRIMLKKGKLNWQSFEPRAFRYLQIEFRRCPKPVAVEHIRVNQTTYPVRQTGAFECSDDLLNAIFKAGVYTAQLCMEDSYIDCPWRERGQWWADARITSRTAFYAFNDTALLAQGLRQIASSQDKDGSILGLHPAGDEMLVPDYALLWVFSILDYYAFSDDDALVAELYPTVQRLLKWFAKCETDSGLLLGVPGRLLVDRADLERNGEVTSLNCFYHHALQVASALASIAGNDEDAQEHLDAANRLKVAINKFMYVPRRGLYAECRIDGKLIEKFSRQTNILAALFDITDQYQKAGIFRQLATGALAEITTPYFASYYLEALYSADYHEEALDYLRRKWGDMIKAGATTLWEDFIGEGSLCHGSAVCPARDLIAEYVGIKPVLGTHRFSVTPHPANLRWARGSVETASGTLSVDWRVLRNRLDIFVEVPEGLKVDVYPPGLVDSTIAVDGKQWPTRFVTLSGGKHEVRVTAPKPPKISTYDEPLASPLPHVEVLDRGTRVGRGRSVILEPRRRGRRGERFDEPIDSRMETTSADEEELVFGEEPELERPVTETAEEEASSKRRRRPRGGRGRSRTSAEEPAVAEAPSETAPTEVSAQPAAEAPQPEAAEEGAPATKRRRRSRGGRGRGRSSAAPEQTPSEETQPEVSIEQPSEPEPSHPEAEPSEEGHAPKRRRRSRGGRGRGRSSSAVPAPEASPAESESTIEGYVVAPLMPEPAHYEPEPVHDAPETAQGEPESSEAGAPKRRRRSRGGRGRGRSAATELTPSAEAQPQPVEEQPSEPEVIHPEPEAAEEGAAPKRRRRPRGGRGRGRSSEPASEAPEHAPESPEPASEAHAHEPAREAARIEDVSPADKLYQAHPLTLTPEPAPTAEPSVEAPKKKRTYARRKKTEDQPPTES